jgi:hypothetical protein
MIKIYHYSDQDFKGYIKPSFFGLNSFTNNSAKISSIKRSFFYLQDKKSEYYFGGAKFLYISEVKKSDIYDYTKDILKLKEKNLQYTDILRLIKKLKFKGIKGNNGFDIVCLFDNVKIKDKIKRF